MFFNQCNFPFLVPEAGNSVLFIGLFELYSV